MRYVKAKDREIFEAKAYRIYVTDCLNANLDNPSNPRYVDIIDRTPVDTRNPEDIIDHIRSGLRSL